MKKLAIAVALLSCALGARADTAAAPTVERLSEADVAAALDALKNHFLQRQELTPPRLERATLAGLLHQLGPGAVLKSAPVPAESPLRSETIAGTIGYVRLGALNPTNLAALDGALTGFGTAAVKALILDLRATPAGGGYESAADLLGRFCAKGHELFALKSGEAGAARVFTSTRDPGFRGLVVVLADAENGGPAEVIAAVLRQQTRAMVIGRTTSGRAVEYASVNLQSGGVLEVATAEAVLPDGATLYPQGVKPDLEAGMPLEIKRSVLVAELSGGVGPALASPEVARMNEAALVSGGTPEIDAMEAQQRNRDRKAPPPQDSVLQRAVDVITSISVLQRGGS